MPGAQPGQLEHQLGTGELMVGIDRQRAFERRNGIFAPAHLNQDRANAITSFGIGRIEFGSAHEAREGVEQLPQPKEGDAEMIMRGRLPWI